MILYSSAQFISEYIDVFDKILVRLHKLSHDPLAIVLAVGMIIILTVRSYRKR